MASAANERIRRLGAFWPKFDLLHFELQLFSILSINKQLVQRTRSRIYPQLNMAVASLTRAFTTCSATSVPLFLAPAFVRPVITTTAPSSSRLYGSTTGGEEKTKPKPNLALHLRPKVDKNKQRGVSAIRRTGPRSMRGRWRYALPVPVARDHRTTAPEYEGTADHGLWGFFDDSRQPMLPPEQEGSHGMQFCFDFWGMVHVTLIHVITQAVLGHTRNYL